VDRAITGSVSHVSDATGIISENVILMSQGDAQQKKGVRKTLLILTVVALAFYLGFILMGVLRA
jgi:hypothetical protein